MFNYSEKTVVNKPFKINELFKLIKADKALKTNSNMVTAIKLSHVLSPTTTNLEPSDNVKEIYIIQIEVNCKEIPEEFIEQFNKQIYFQTLFKICYNKEVKYICSLKQFDQESSFKILKTYYSDWQKQLQLEMPITTKLEMVYKTILATLTGATFHVDETLEDYMERVGNIKKQKQEIEKLTRIMNAEKQPNIRMEMNDTIKQLSKELQKMER